MGLSDRGFIAHCRESDQATQSLEDHLQRVAERARSSAGKVGLQVHGELIGLLHDFGKYSDAFQNYLKSGVGLLNQDDDEEFVDARGLKGKIDHSTAGAQVIWRSLAERGDLARLVGQILALCIASHHSGLIDCLSSDARSFGEDAFGRRINKGDSRTHFDEASSKADKELVQRVHDLLAEPALVEDMRRAIARIIGRSSHKEALGLAAQQQVGLLVRFLLSCLVDADRADTAEFERRSTPANQEVQVAWDDLVNRLDSHLERLPISLPIDSVRREISDHCFAAAARPKGVYSLTVPTGGGKTLASLRFALHHARLHNLDRIIYFIPYTSIIDQNAKEVSRILEPSEARGSVVLEHHSNLTPAKVGWRTKALADGWSRPVVFTTNVQFLETLFGSGTRSVRRLHQLANAVLVFDEVQTLPVRCVHLFNNAINFLVQQCGTTAVLCTATQPLLDRVDTAKGAISLAAERELVPDVKGLFEHLRRVDVISRRVPGGWTDEQVVSLATDEASNSGSCLVVVNTKETARKLYGLVEEGSALATYHLSTNMCPRHRKLVLARIKKQLRRGYPRVVCFSTQLIEAGVDIDFGAVVRFAAGLDSIAQAAGRCNRHGRRSTGRVHVINPAGENLDRLIDIRAGRDIAARVIDDWERDPNKFGDNLIGPEAMEWYYKNYFLARADSMDYPVSGVLGHDDTLLSLLSTNSLAAHEHYRRLGAWPRLHLRQSFAAAADAFEAIDAPTRGIVVPYGTAGNHLVAELYASGSLENLHRLVRRAQEYSVNVFPHVLKRLADVGAVREVIDGSGILALDSRYYSTKFGLTEEPASELEFLNV
jgi:CRISPR-associated endonuclease/helicase Cas3